MTWLGRLGWILGSLVLLVVVRAVIGAVVYSPLYVWRVLTSVQSEYEDYLYTSQRKVGSGRRSGCSPSCAVRNSTGSPKTRDGNVEAIRVLMIARRSAVDARIETLNQLRHVVFTATPEIRSKFTGLTAIGLVNKATALRPREGDDPVRYTTLVTIRALGHRVQYLREETKRLNRMLRPLIRQTAPTLLEVYGVGYDTAARLLVAAGGVGHLISPHLVDIPLPDRNWSISSSSMRVPPVTVRKRSSHLKHRDADGPSPPPRPCPGPVRPGVSP